VGSLIAGGISPDELRTRLPASWVECSLASSAAAPDSARTADLLQAVVQDISSPVVDDSKPSSVKAQRKLQALVHEQQLMRRTALVAEMLPIGDPRSAGIESREQAQARILSQDSRESMAWLLARPFVTQRWTPYLQSQRCDVA